MVPASAKEVQNQAEIFDDDGTHSRSSSTGYRTAMRGDQAESRTKTEQFANTSDCDHPSREHSNMETTRAEEEDIWQGPTTPFDADMLQGLRALAEQHRLTKGLEMRFNEAFAGLDAEEESVQTKHAQLKMQLERCEEVREASSSDSKLDAAGIQEEMAALEDQEATISRKRTAGDKNLARMYRELREDQYNFFEMVEAYAINNSLLAPLPADNALAEEQGSAKESKPSHERQPVSDEQHDSYAVGLVEQDQQRYAETPSEQTATDVQYEEILHSLEIFKTELLEAQWQLDNRYDQFDQEDWERKQQDLHREQDAETREVLDLRRFEETRLMTQRVIRAEAELERVRQEALAAGIQNPASDVESRFIDDVDDGYRISHEQDMIASVDEGWINAWLESFADGADSRAEVEKAASPEDCSECSLKEGEICDSASVVAEGPYRRRIDEWAKMTNALGRLKMEHTCVKDVQPDGV